MQSFWHAFKNNKYQEHLTSRANKKDDELRRKWELMGKVTNNLWNANEVVLPPKDAHGC